ncbi:MAG: hypothetical protein Q8Q31_05235 [Nanoarchaeota archaeon]|nr:hypothetical protein [Nanoarchaeota archaeon]
MSEEQRKGRILVIEDDPRQQDIARSKLGDIEVISTFREFQEALSNHNITCILSDLYFPNGYGNNSEIYQAHKREVVSQIESYLKEVDFSTPFLNAVELVFRLEVTSDNLEKIVSDMEKVGFTVDNNTPSILSENIKKRDQLRSYRALSLEIATDSHLMPEGLFVYDFAKKHSIPCVIVTSEYHHGTKFQPFASKLGNYVDQLENGEKQWKKAHNMLKMKGGSA